MSAPAIPLAEDTGAGAPLRAGMTVTVSVDTGRSRGLPEFIGKLTR